MSWGVLQFADSISRIRASVAFLQSGCLRAKSKTAFLFRTFIIYGHALFIITIMVIIHKARYDVKSFFVFFYIVSKSEF